MRLVLALIGPLALAGCECGSGFAVAFSARDGSTDIEAVATRCFVDAHTLVVGPSEGCATLTFVGTGDAVCTSAAGAAGYAPVRVVREGNLPVWLRFGGN